MPKTGGSAKAARRRARKKAGAAEARRKREFSYRGYSLEELQAMSLEELLPLLPARVRRTFSRGLSPQHRRVVEKLSADGENGVVRTHRRDVPILPAFVGKSVAVYNGKQFVQFEIRPEMIGHYLGEFALTRQAVKHSGPGVGATRSSKFLPLK